KDETKQMNNSIVWFRTNYGDVKCKNIMIINAKSFGKGAALDEEVEVMTEKKLTSLKKNVLSFFSEFKDVDFNDISDEKTQEFLVRHKLTVEDILSLYSEKIFQRV